MKRVADIMRHITDQKCLRVADRLHAGNKGADLRRGAVTLPGRKKERHHCDQEDRTWV